MVMFFLCTLNRMLATHSGGNRRAFGVRFAIGPHYNLYTRTCPVEPELRCGVLRCDAMWRAAGAQ